MTKSLRAGARLAGVLACGVWAAVACAAAAEARQERPNIVFILSDDEDVASHAFMPKTKALIEDQGVAFENYFVTYSFCCPSRATLLRGQYSHNHRIQGNVLPTGGALKFRALGHDKSTIATWLQAAGYRTGLIGKYMNEYDPAEGYVPPGWDEWYGTGNGYYDYVVNENGNPVRYGDREEDYLTDVLAGYATSTIRRAAAGDAPFFLLITPFAPHSPEIAAPRHQDLFAGATYPRPASFDEADVADKPSLIRDLPRLAPWQLEAIDNIYRRRLRTLQSVDDLVERVFAVLRETGELENTYVIYSSDNGWHMGEHRQFVGKTTAYEEDIRVPFVMRGPGVPRGARLAPFVLNNDIAPTLAAMAGVTPPSFVDGRSFLPLLSDPAQPWRQSFGIERRQRETMEIVGPASFHAVRTADWTYVEYYNGERELYDLRADPQQLDNVVTAAEPLLLEQLSKRLAELANCAAAHCREIEDAPLMPTVALSSGDLPETTKQ
ncbi:MAG TPA: sulfatase [Kiloniellaceae bacterium]